VYPVLAEGLAHGDAFEQMLRGIAGCGARLRGLIQTSRAA
jgi:hypothetical protein